MSSNKQPLVGHFSPPHGSVQSYIFGFVASLILTLTAYAIATTDGASRNLIIGSIALMAATQCVIQLVCFLHLGQEFKPRWNLMIFGLMVTIVLIVVIGSLWIMNNLNYRMMHTPKQLQEYVKGQDGL